MPKNRGNGTGSVYKNKHGWVARIVRYYYIDENGKRKPKCSYKTGLRTKTEANLYLDTLRNKKPVKVKTFNDYWNTYEKTDKFLKLSGNRQTAYKKAKKRLQDVMYIPITEIDIESLQKCVNNRATTHYTAKDMKTVLSHLYDLACAEQAVQANLSPYIALPELNEAEGIPFTKDEQKRLWGLYEHDDFVPYILLMIYTGMMPGELLLAKKENVDFDKQTITGIGIKTNKRKETPIIIPNVAIPILKKIFEMSRGDKLIHINKDTFYDEYYACLERAKCDRKPPYSCRHTKGTSLAEVPIAIAKELMRHTKITTTQRYIHVDTQTMLDTANSVNNSVNNREP